MKNQIIIWDRGLCTTPETKNVIGKIKVLQKSTRCLRRTASHLLVKRVSSALHLFLNVLLRVCHNTTITHPLSEFVGWYKIHTSSLPLFPDLLGHWNCNVSFTFASVNIVEMVQIKELYPFNHEILAILLLLHVYNYAYLDHMPINSDFLNY